MDHQIIQTKVSVTLTGAPATMGRNSKGEGITIMPERMEVIETPGADGLLLILTGYKVRENGALSGAFYEVRLRVGERSGDRLPAAPQAIAEVALAVLR